MATTELARSPEPDIRLARREPFALPAVFGLGSARSVAAVWTASRAATLVMLALFEGTVSGDANYYARNLHLLFSGGGGVRAVLQEYPLPVLGIMLPQYLAGGLNSVAFSIIFGASMLGFDALFTRSIWRFAGRERSAALVFWLWFLPLIGPMAYFRFDLVTAVLAGGAVLAAFRRPWISGALTAAGAALKLWPVVILPVFLLRRGSRRSVTAAFLATGAAIAGVCLAVGGWDRLVSPLRWQQARGLQIEAVPASPLMLANAIRPHTQWSVHISAYKAYEIFGAGVAGTLTALTYVTVVAGVLLAWLWWRAFRLPAVSPELLGWLFLAAATVVTVTNKTLSPQYIIWLGGPVAALLLFAPGDRVVRRATALLLVVAVLTQLVYPTTYPNLLTFHLLKVPVNLLLLLRNVVLVWLTWVACAQVWRMTKRAS